MSMFPEYLYNNDTQDIAHHVHKLALSDEPALRAHCQEVSHQTDTSSLCLQEDCVRQSTASGAVLEAMGKCLRELSQALSENTSVFGTQNGRADFSTVCQTVTRIEEERLHLLEHISAQTQMRRALASSVADANRALHFLSIARRAVSVEVHRHYDEAIERVECAYRRFTKADDAIREVQNFYMTVVERHLPAFMERLRIAADFNHAGEALNRSAIRTLCAEFLILQNHAPNVSF